MATRDRDSCASGITTKKSSRTNAPSASALLPVKQSSAVKNVRGHVPLGSWRHYMWPSRYSRLTPEAVLDDWNIFVQDIKVHSGKHRHQGSSTSSRERAVRSPWLAT